MSWSLQTLWGSHILCVVCAIKTLGRQGHLKSTFIIWPQPFDGSGWLNWKDIGLFRGSLINQQKRKKPAQEYCY